MQKWTPEEFKILWTREEIDRRIRAMGETITRDYAQLTEPLIVVAMLRGSLYFVADLTRAIALPLTFDFIGISPFEAGSETREIRVTKDLSLDIRGRHVLVMEEIVRTGLTTNLMLQLLEEREPASLTLAAFLASEEQLFIDLPLKYVGFEIDYRRVAGYGMDFQDKARNLPFVAELDKDYLLRRPC